MVSSYFYTDGLIVLKCLNCSRRLFTTTAATSTASWCIVFPVFNSDVPRLKKELDELVDAIVENFFEPQKNKLEPKPQ